MSKLNMSKVFNDAKILVSKHSPEILTGLGIASMVTTTVLAVKATPKALSLIEDAEHEKGEKLTAPEKVKVAWKPYAPAVVSGVFGAACLIGANSVNARRNAALATAYKLSETALSDYREKVVETIGEKKERVVRDKVAEEQVKRNPVSKSELVITDKGNSLCFDPMSGRYFKTNIDLIKKAENNLNKKMLHSISGYVSLNDFYDELGLPHTDIGDDIGWNTDRLIDMELSAQVSEQGEPSLVLEYLTRPQYDYFGL